MNTTDALCQYVMCNSDETLSLQPVIEMLDTTKWRFVKIGKDWDLVREWAQERSAYYVDSELHFRVQRWGDCDNGDVLPVGSLLGWNCVTTAGLGEMIKLSRDISNQIENLHINASLQKCFWTKPWILYSNFSSLNILKRGIIVLVYLENHAPPFLR